MAKPINVGQDLCRAEQSRASKGDLRRRLWTAETAISKRGLVYLLCGKVPLRAEEILFVLCKDGHIILLCDRRVRPLLNHLQVDGVGFICRGPHPHPECLSQGTLNCYLNLPALTQVNCVRTIIPSYGETEVQRKGQMQPRSRALDFCWLPPNLSPIEPWTLRRHRSTHGYFLPSSLLKNGLLLQWLCPFLLLPQLSFAPVPSWQRPYRWAECTGQKHSILPVR